MKLSYCHSVFICSKLTIKILENGVNDVQNYQKKTPEQRQLTWTQLFDANLVSFFLTLLYFESCSNVSNVNFELINVSWEFCGYMLIFVQSLHTV